MSRVETVHNVSSLSEAGSVHHGDVAIECETAEPLAAAFMPARSDCVAEKVCRAGGAVEGGSAKICSVATFL